ncbi:MAG: hypothetical protein ACC619_09000, partial [Paracoccaceae bacterium]
SERPQGRSTRPQGRYFNLAQKRQGIKGTTNGHFPSAAVMAAADHDLFALDNYRTDRFIAHPTTFFITRHQP